MVDFAVSLAQAGKSAACAPGCCSPVSPRSGRWPQGTYGSPKFPENPMVPMPCSWTPAEPWCLAFTAPRCCPPTSRRGGPRRQTSFRSSITRPQHWLFTLRAAIADDDAKLASGGWPVFPEWDSSLPTEFCREVSAFRFPLPLGFAWRDLNPCRLPFWLAGRFASRRGGGAIELQRGIGGGEVRDIGWQGCGDDAGQGGPVVQVGRGLDGVALAELLRVQLELKTGLAALLRLPGAQRICSGPQRGGV